MDFFSSPDDQARKEDLKQAILAQLSQASEIHHIDDVFLWLTHMIVKRFEIQVAQVWAMQATTMGQSFPQLRSVLCQDRSLSQNIVVNTHVATLVGRMLHMQRDIPLHPVDASFTQYLALLLKRHGLYYCAGTLSKGDSLLPPPRMSTSGQKIATPLAAGLLLFFRHPPDPDTLPAVSDIFAQALVFADSRGLLSVKADHGTLPYPQAEAQPAPPAPLAPAELIARRCEDPLSNPISASAALPEEQMRRIYSIINDQRNMAELAKLSRLDLKDVLLIARKLAVMQRIQIYDPTGRRIDNLSILEIQ